MNDIDLSVVMITLNEEKNLERCLRSLPKGCEIVILDSHSQDQTEQIAQSFNAKFHQREFDDFASQKNAAIDLASKNWILSIDADEEIDASLRSAIEYVIKNNSRNINAYKLSRHLVFLDRHMKFGKTKDSPIRLFRKNKARFKNKVHEVLQVENNTISALSSGVMLHYSYADITDYFKRFNRYTSNIAEQHFERGKPKPSMLFMIVRPSLEFCVRYIFRLGFLDGFPGFCYALFSSTYAFTKYAKLMEKHQRFGTRL